MSFNAQMLASALTHPSKSLTNKSRLLDVMMLYGHQQILNLAMSKIAHQVV